MERKYRIIVTCYRKDGSPFLTAEKVITVKEISETLQGLLETSPMNRAKVELIEEI